MKYILSFLLCAASPLCALLAPLQQDLREWRALLDSPQLIAALSSGDTIQEIRREGLLYRITSGEKELTVEVRYLPQHRIGPQEFELIFH